MKRDDDLFWTAKEAVYSTQLSAWEHLQLFFFLNHSFDRNKAGQFLLDKLADLGPDGSREEYLRSMIDDTRSLAQKCTISWLRCHAFLYRTSQPNSLRSLPKHSHIF